MLRFSPKVVSVPGFRNWNHEGAARPSDARESNLKSSRHKGKICVLCVLESWRLLLQPLSLCYPQLNR